MHHFTVIGLKSLKSHLRSAERAVFARPTKAIGKKPTPRELEVEDLLCRGYSQENIAAIFGRSIHTVSVHVLSLYKKRGVHTQVGLLLAYLERKGINAFPDEGNDHDPLQRMPAFPVECYEEK